MNKTLNKLSIIVTTFLLYLGIFLFIQKPIFMIYNAGDAGLMTFHNLLDIYYNGIALDLAASAYLVAIPWCILLVSLFLPSFRYVRVLKIYNLVMALLLSIIIVVDTSLYEFWMFKLDSTVFMYINDPKNAMASVSVGYVILRLIWIVAQAGVLYLITSLPLRFFGKEEKGRDFKLIMSLIVWLMVGGALFGLIRGFRVWPNTPARAFYCTTPMLNNSALNPLYNVIYSLSKMDKFDDEFQEFDEKECDAILHQMFPTHGEATPLLKTNRPNILLIVVEGFGACFIEQLGGKYKEVAPYTSRLCKESVNFTHTYCSSFRTDRGIVSVLSGYPGQPTTSIMRFTHKLPSLPGLPKTLRAAGYDTSVLYSSDMTFFNMSDYFIAVGHDRLISENDFPQEQRTAKWGVHDEYAFNWLLNDIQDKYKNHAEPWYTTMLTISSHTPFDVPYHRLKDEKHNSFAYTDSCLNDFVTRLKATPAWDNLLVVVTADHGYNHDEMTAPDFPHIPFLMLGGAIKEAKDIDVIAGQTDIAATILGQLQLPHEDFIFSRDVMADTYQYPFSFSTFNNGFNFRDSTGVTVFDNTSKKALHNDDADRIRKGKAILQKLYKDLSNR